MTVDRRRTRCAGVEAVSDIADLMSKLRRTAGYFGPPGSGVTTDLLRESADALEQMQALVKREQGEMQTLNAALKTVCEDRDTYFDALELISAPLPEDYGLATKVAREALGRHRQRQR